MILEIELSQTKVSLETMLSPFLVFPKGTWLVNPGGNDDKFFQNYPINQHPFVKIDDQKAILQP